MSRIIPTREEFVKHEPVARGYDLARSKVGIVAILSAALSIIALTSSIFLMLIYDSVLPSGSVETLVVLTALVAFVYSLQAIFDTIRQRLMQRLSQVLSDGLTLYLQRLEMRELAVNGGQLSGGPVKSFDRLRDLLTGGAPLAFFDLVWTPLFLSVLALMHLYLAAVALLGIGALGAWAWYCERVTVRQSEALTELHQEANARRAALRRHANLLWGIGASDRVSAMASRTAGSLIESQTKLAERAAMHNASGRAARLLVQSAVLAVGAALVLDGQATGGIIFAAAILAGRSLAPIDQIVGQWRGIIAGGRHWRELRSFLARTAPPDEPRMTFEPPKAELTTVNLSVAPFPGSDPVIAALNLRVRPGELLGVIGPSGAGKSTLLRCMAGTLPSASGIIKLGGISYNQWQEQTRGSYLGYLPQSVDLMAGRVADNIARFDDSADPASIIEAAKLAGIHESILSLPEGYDTLLVDGGRNLSGGLCQRIGIARAMYGDARILLLDEPNSNLDPESLTGLVQAIARWIATRKSAIIVSHQAAILRDARNLLLLRPGKEPILGPRDATLSQLRDIRAERGSNVIRAR